MMHNNHNMMHKKAHQLYLEMQAAGWVEVLPNEKLRVTIKGQQRVEEILSKLSVEDHILVMLAVPEIREL